MEAKKLDDSFSELLIQELSFTFTKGSGPGGQHVNKVNTRVELHFNIPESTALSSEQKEQINQNLKNRITSKGMLILSSEEERSQLRNKKRVMEKFLELITLALTPEKQRKATKPPSSSTVKRLEEKRKISEKKQFRRKPEDT